MRYFSWLCAVAMLSVFVAAGSLRANQEEIDVDDLPAAVVESVAKKFPRSEYNEAIKETNEDETLYEVGLVYRDYQYYVLLTSAGEILEIDKEIDGDELPNLVLALLAKDYEGVEAASVEEITVNGKVTFGVMLKIGEKKRLFLEFEADAKILDREEYEVE